jgi:class 3 adenylate cyclase
VVETKDAATAGTVALGVEIDHPEAYLAGDRRRAVAAGETIPDRVRGAALFADISGFTTLTEALADQLGSQRGAEELTVHLNRVFHAVIDELDRYGGEVIYFSGDAITCWLDGDDGMRATACALAMQDVMRRVGEATTPSGTTVRLAMKVAVAVGAARRGVVGDPEIQLIDVLAGRLVDELAAAEQRAERDEVVLAPSALETLGPRVQLAARRSGGDGCSYSVVGSLGMRVDSFPAAPSAGPLPEELVRQWVLPAVYERLRTGRGEFLAELRPAFPLFVGFRGIDYDEDDAAIEKLDDFVRRAQRILTGFLFPVKNPPVLNVAVAGDLMPIRFSLGGNRGLNILAPGSPAVTTIPCPTGATLNNVPALSPVPKDLLIYIPPPINQYLFVWKTTKSWVNTCRSVTLKLVDGTTHVAIFKFKKEG